MIVYICGPLTSTGDLGQNMRDALELAAQVRRFGHVPLVPHLLWFGHAFGPEPISRGEAMRECLSLLRRSDGLIRLDPDDLSDGAAEEEETARRLGLPIFRDPGHLPAPDLAEEAERARRYADNIERSGHPRPIEASELARNLDQLRRGQAEAEAGAVQITLDRGHAEDHLRTLERLEQLERRLVQLAGLPRTVDALAERVDALEASPLDPGQLEQLRRDVLGPFNAEAALVADPEAGA